MQREDIVEYLLQADHDDTLKRVKDPLPRPTICDCCGSVVKLVDNREFYGKSYGAWPLAYMCSNKACGATVGCHPKTTIPLGKMADRDTKYMRSQVHKLMDPFWRGVKRPGMRSGVYRRLAQEMGLSSSECHVGLFSVEQCRQAIKIVKGWSNGSDSRKTG